MATETVLYIIMAGIIALCLSVFQYYYKQRHRSGLSPLFAFLRFLVWFGLFLLLINPKVTRRSYEKEKASLVIAVDNSSSVNFLKKGEEAVEVMQQLLDNEELDKRFNLQAYMVSDGIKELDSLTFTGKRSDLSGALSGLKKLYANSTAPVVLITDGNQTYGEDYEFSSRRFDQPVYPVVLGDTIPYTDITVARININRYAFLKNRFPVEIFTQYTGKEEVSSILTIKQGRTVLFSKPVTFSENQKSQVVSTTIYAGSVGVQQYQVTLSPVNEEINTSNNTRSFAIEVIDERTNVLLVSDISHPDVGTLKKSIESNQQRTVTVKRSNEVHTSLDNYQLVILYQPTAAFKNVWEAVKKHSKNVFFITGTQTDWQFLNGIQSDFEKERNFQTEEYQPVTNPSFHAFQPSALDLSGFPPLKGFMGEVQINTAYDVLLTKKIQNVETNTPLMVTMSSEEKRKALLQGEDLWKWRMQSFLDTGSFESFDTFFGKCIFYLSSKKRSNRLTTDYESFYYGNSDINISASYFDSNYIFDPNAQLNIVVSNVESEEVYRFPMLLKNNYYGVDLSNLKPGTYNFTVSVNDHNFSASGRFTVLPFDVESQFMNADLKKLKILAANTGGAYYTPTETDKLIKNLLEEERYTPVQKSVEKSVSLIDWKYLLFGLALLLAIEWFIRKYNGLI